MSLKNIIAIGMVSAAVFSSAVASAKEDFYVQLNGGAAFGLAPKGDYGNKKAGSSGLVGAEAGYKINEYFRTSVSLDYLTNFSFKDVDSLSDSNGITTKHNTNWEVKSLVAMVNLYYDVIELDGFTPYVTLGAGVAKNKAKGIQKVSDSKVSKGYSGNKTNFAYKAGLGTKYSFSEEIDFDLRYQFVDLGKIKAGSGDYVHNGKLRTHELLLGVAYKF